MPFPISPNMVAKPGDKFLIHDPFRLRRSVLPLLRHDVTAEMVYGWGTGFRIDPFGTVITAYHIVEDFLSFSGQSISLDSRLRDDQTLFGFELSKRLLGRAHFSSENWSIIEEIATHVRAADDPFVDQPARNICETAALTMPPRNGTKAQSVPVHIAYRPVQGEILLAIGFADLDVSGPTHPDNMAIIGEALYGSFGTITEIRNADPLSGRPWPTLVVDADWPPGMSGGPVFNEAGHVVGLVSTGNSLASYSTAVWFGGWRLHEQIMDQLDPLNPGMLKGWGIFDQNDRLKVFHTGSPSKLIERARELGVERIYEMSWKHGTRNMIRSPVPLDQEPIFRNDAGRSLGAQQASGIR